MSAEPQLLLAAATSVPRAVWAIPLILVISLVRSASRQEAPAKIFRGAAIRSLKILVLLAVALAGLYLLPYVLQFVNFILAHRWLTWLTVALIITGGVQYLRRPGNARSTAAAD